MLKPVPVTRLAAVRGRSKEQALVPGIAGMARFNFERARRFDTQQGISLQAPAADALLEVREEGG
jgi:hypothetical protein